jgi:lipoate-protein ligase A
MQFLDLTLETAADNLALDEALLLEAESAQAGAVLRFWELPRPAVVLGAGCVLAQDVDEPACLADGVPILRRASGGGTVLLGAGCLCYTLVLAYDEAPELAEIASSYRYLLGRVGKALAAIHPGIEPAGTSDLAVAGRKFSGNAQQRKRHCLLHHGTLLYGFDLELVGRYLRQPQRQPDYRGQRDHATFLMNLPVEAAELKQRLRGAWGAEEEITNWPEKWVRQLVAEKYAKVEWVRRR